MLAHAQVHIDVSIDYTAERYQYKSVKARRKVYSAFFLVIVCILLYFYAIPFTKEYKDRDIVNIRAHCDCMLRDIHNKSA